MKLDILIYKHISSHCEVSQKCSFNALFPDPIPNKRAPKSKEWKSQNKGMFVCTLQMGDNIYTHSTYVHCTMLNDTNILNFAPSCLSKEQKCQMDSILNLGSSYFSAFSSECARCFFVLFLFFPFHCILLLLHPTYLVCFSSKLKVKFDRESSFDSRIISTQYERGNIWKLCLAGCVCHDSGMIFFSVL